MPMRRCLWLAAATLLLAPAGTAAGQSVTSLPPPRVVPFAERVVSLTPRVISVAPKQTALNTFNVGADILFAFNSSTLSPSAQSVLSGVISQLTARHSGTVTIRGYTDSIGTPAYNLGLSQRRAAAVQAFLRSKVPSLGYRAQGLGEADPVAPNTLPNGKDNPAGRQQNRRVVISYSP